MIFFFNFLIFLLMLLSQIQKKAHHPLPRRAQINFQPHLHHPLPCLSTFLLFHDYPPHLFSHLDEIVKIEETRKGKKEENVSIILLCG